ncbi:hypothetical protein CSIM01_06474 [Colletotrichum simmondsii]|uniref:Uncharacterized protein n=1 Tax=Colletotrichum simmondsii TaxID=703756 RepID=A0A135TGD6_9PEZI|nr:hypothetical protein CSIM01_06474 [Colletotrichum simmondsii]
MEKARSTSLPPQDARLNFAQLLNGTNVMWGQIEQAGSWHHKFPLFSHILRFPPARLCQGTPRTDSWRLTGDGGLRKNTHKASVIASNLRQPTSPVFGCATAGTKDQNQPENLDRATES